MDKKMISRRFLLGAGFGLTATSVGMNINHAILQSKLPHDPDPDPDPDQADDWYMHNAHLPPVFKDRVFLGYRALPAAKTQMENFSAYFPRIKAAIDIMRAPDPLLTNCRLTERACADGVTFLDICLEKMPAAYQPAARQFAGEVARLKSDYEINHLTNYNSRVDLVTNCLLEALRDVDYVAHNDNKGLAKTPGQLMSDGTGDCKDFAFARYLIAQSLGVLPDHLAIISYAAERGPGHWNLAVYNPEMQNWFIVDGTGRKADETMGYSNYYTNDEKLWRQFGSPDLYPVQAFNQSGIFAFNSFIRYDAGHGQNIFAKRESFNADSTFEVFENSKKRDLKTLIARPRHDHPILKLSG